MNKINIPRAALKALLLFAAKQDIRYYLNGICVEATKKTTRLIATNGHVLAVHHSVQDNEVDGPVSVIVPRQAIELLRSQPTRSKKTLLLDVRLEQMAEGWQLRDYTNGLRLGFDPIEGKFPDYIKVIPTKVSGVTGNFNPEYIGLLAQAKKFFRSRHGLFSIGHNGPNGALVRMVDVPEFVAVVMPLRDAPAAERPDWLPVPEPELAAPVAEGAPA